MGKFDEPYYLFILIKHLFVILILPSYHFDKLRYGHLKLDSNRIRHILYWSDELVVPSE